MIGRHTSLAGAALAAAIALPACASDNDLVLADAAHDAQAAADARAQLVAQADALLDAAVTLCAAAPAPAGDGWNETRDAASIAAMKKAWKDARRAYAGLDGAVATLFPARAAALDERYEDALAVGTDPDAFDDKGFVGLHAVERILWADRAPASVWARESTLAGYQTASFPADEDQAARFRTGLCDRLVADADALGDELREADVDASVAYAGAARLVSRQLEKLVHAGEGLDESRYAGYSLADMSAGVASAKATQGVFRSWLLTKADGAHTDEEVTEAFAQLEKEYAAFGTDALPYVPMGWSTADLTHDALATPFGQLFIVVSNEANEGVKGSLAREMEATADALGIGVDEAD